MSSWKKCPKGQKESGNKRTATAFVKPGVLTELSVNVQVKWRIFFGCREVRSVDPPRNSASVSQTGVVRHPGPNKLVCKQVSRCLVYCKHFFFSREFRSWRNFFTFWWRAAETINQPFLVAVTSAGRLP